MPHLLAGSHDELRMDRLRHILLLVALLAAPSLPAQITGQFQSAELTMSYAESGSGDAVVILAGGPGLSSSYLKGLVELLDENHRVIVFDRRGTGGSRPAAINAETVSVALMIQDIEALRRHLELPRWTVLGHSFGTFMAMRYAAEHPAAVERLVLLSGVSPTDCFSEFSAALEARSSPEAAQRMAQIRAAIAAAETEAQRGELMGQLQFELLPAYFADSAKLADLLADSGPAGSQADVFLHVRRQIDGYDITEQLEGIRIPTLIVQGAADPMTPALAERTRATTPAATLAVLPDAGHFAWLEAPSRLSAEIEAFLSDPL